ncbi:hypothetical protein C8R45DRAFT_1081168 [Mycena sanguinolenta]|nr:hypothetical protein C8R45DRAFT_1081168 [Mycena sanguinolenta]
MASSYPIHTIHITTAANTENRKRRSRVSKKSTRKAGQMAIRVIPHALACHLRLRLRLILLTLRPCHPRRSYTPLNTSCVCSCPIAQRGCRTRAQPSSPAPALGSAFSSCPSSSPSTEQLLSFVPSHFERWNTEAMGKRGQMMKRAVSRAIRGIARALMFWLWLQARKPWLFGFGTRAKARPKPWPGLAFSLAWQSSKPGPGQKAMAFTGN